MITSIFTNFLPALQQIIVAAATLLSLQLLPFPATAQRLPGALDATRLLQDRPDLAAQVRQQVGASGMTAEQIRARLAASGFPADFLDLYLAGTDTTRTVEFNPMVLEALRVTGIGVPEQVDRPTGVTGSRAAESTDPTQLPLFGEEVFRRGGSRFEPTLSGPVDANYRLGPGDVLVLILTGDVELARTLEVNREGFVVVPQVGQLYLANLQMAQVEDLLYERLGRVYSGVRRGAGATTQFQITVARMRTSQVYVVGDVLTPGSYQISAAGTVLTALYAAGGPTESGNFRRIEVRRAGVTVDSLDLYEYLLRGSSSHDIRLETGDVVFVPVKGARVAITGRVVRPAVYELRPDETLRDLIRAAGGFEADALRRRVQVHRILPPAARSGDGKDRVVIDLTSEQFADSAGPAFQLIAGDSVTVFEVAPRRRGFVAVKGNVWMTGTVGFTNGMLLSDAIRLAGGPKPDYYEGQILVSRLRADSTRVQLRTAFADTTGNILQDMLLQDEDEIQVFSRSDFRPARYVSIVGAVRAPGRLPYRDGMTLRDAILQVKGLVEDADLREVEIARLPEDRDDGALATTLRVRLDSTYLFERGPNGEYAGPPGISVPASGAAEVVLQPYDNILVLRQTEWSLQRVVTISGEVAFAGTYALRTRTDRITDLIRRAGGLTSTAYPVGVEFHRAKDNRGRVGIDLPSVLRDSTFRDNFILFDGDSIFIPEYDPVVQVGGAVNAPRSVSWVPGKNIDYYIGAAGGLTHTADGNRRYVMQPSGQVESFQKRFFLLPDSHPEPLAGARVVVPEKVDTPSKETLTTLATIASIVASLATVVIVAIK
jgi:protein involved in polysaccharide export with SLBB domain